jgi:hypothetical protein
MGYTLRMPYRTSSLDMVFELTDKGVFVVLTPWGMYEGDSWFSVYWAAVADRSAKS